MANMVEQEIVPTEEVEKLMDEIEAKIEEICESLNRPTGRDTHAAELVRTEADHFYSGIWRAITGRSDGWR